MRAAVSGALIALGVVLATAGGGSGTTPAYAEGSDAADSTCEVSAATLTWGFKESWRAYIDGSIANGSWETSDGADYETPNFLWSVVTGSADASGTAGELSFTGSVHFTGHSGVLDMTVANPTVVLSGADSASVLIDISSKQEDGSVVEATQAAFASVDVSQAEVSVDGDTVSITDAPASLTAEGASAFSGYYAEGEELDPVTITYSLDASCSASESATAEAGTSSAAAVSSDASSAPASSESAVSSSGLTAGWTAAIVGVVVVALAAAAAVWLRARKGRVGQ